MIIVMGHMTISQASKMKDYQVVCTIIRETDAAMLVRLDDEDTEVWLPLSEVISIHRRGHYDEHDKVVIPQWLARKKDLL